MTSSGMVLIAYLLELGGSFFNTKPKMPNGIATRMSFLAHEPNY